VSFYAKLLEVPSIQFSKSPVVFNSIFSPTFAPFQSISTALINGTTLSIPFPLYFIPFYPSELFPFSEYFIPKGPSLNNV